MTNDGELDAQWRAFAVHRDTERRNRLVEAHLPLARTIAATMYAARAGIVAEFGDYLQFATLGLIEAVDRFDPGRGVAFAGFASVRIRGAVLNSLEALSEQYQQVNLRKRLRQERLDSLRTMRPSPHARDRFAALADVTVALALSHLLEDSGMIAGRSEDASAYRQEFYASVFDRQMRDGLLRLVQALPEQERRVVRYHYYQNIAFTEIAALLGVTKGRVSQIHRQALELLRDAQQRPGRLRLDL